MVPRLGVLLAIGGVAALAVFVCLPSDPSPLPSIANRMATATATPTGAVANTESRAEAPLNPTERTAAATSARMRVHVVDDDGRPVAGVTVAAGSQPDSERGDTGADGVAVLQVALGRHWISANYVAPRRRLDLYFAGRSIEVQERLTEIELALSSMRSIVSVVVTSDLGVPLPGAMIEYVHSDRQEVETQTTNVHGVAVFAGLSAGLHSFELLAKSIEDSPLVPPDPAMRTCEVLPRATATLEYRLERKGTACLHVDSAGDLEVPVRLLGKGGQHGLSSRAVTVKAALAVLLPAGEYEAVAEIPAPMPAIARHRVDFSITAGADTQVRIPIETGPSTLLLRIVDDRDEPVGAAHVWLVPRDAGTSAGWKKELFWASATNADYIFAGLPREPVRLHVDCRMLPFRDLAFDGQGPDRPWLDLDVAEGERRIVLHDAYTVCGRLLDRDGKPLTQGRVCRGAVGDDQEVVELQRDARLDGDFGFEFRHLAAGLHRLWIGDRAEGPADGEVKVGPEAGPSRTVRVDLQRR